jgi:hypothetical protein
MSTIPKTNETNKFFDLVNKISIRNETKRHISYVACAILLAAGFTAVTLAGLSHLNIIGISLKGASLPMFISGSSLVLLSPVFIATQIHLAKKYNEDLKKKLFGYLSVEKNT